MKHHRIIFNGYDMYSSVISTYSNTLSWHSNIWYTASFNRGSVIGCGRGALAQNFIKAYYVSVNWGGNIYWSKI